MKKVQHIFLVIFIVSFSILLVSCSNDDKDWKDKDINGYYTYYVGCDFFVHSWAIELSDENINDSTKTFVVRYTNDTYNNGVAEENSFYVSYGYYSIETIYEGEDYIEYHLILDYIVKDKDAPNWETMTVTIKPDTSYCIYNGERLIKRF